MRGELARFGPQAGLADLLDRWPSAVGAGIARNAWPARVGRDGTLHVATADSVWAFELGQRAGEIAERIGVEKVRFAPGPLPRPDEEHVSEPPREATPAQREAAASLASGIADENLRKTVQRAVLLSLVSGAPTASG